MGFSLDLVVSPDGHTSEFVCVICGGLSEYPVITRCSHVFCRQCLLKWIRVRPICPTCNTQLSCKPHLPLGSEHVFDLRGACPLGHRVLSRIRVCCPLKAATGCQWVGEYSEVQSHLTNSQEHAQGAPAAAGTGEGAAAAEGEEAGAVDPRVTAEALKEEGNGKFAAKAYADAIRLYTKAISVVPDAMPALYANRAAALFMLGQRRHLQSCVGDCDAALRLDGGYFKARVRKARALVALGSFSLARTSLLRGLELVAASTAAHRALRRELEAVESVQEKLSRGLELCGSGSFAEGRALLSELLRATNAPGVMLAVSEAEMGLGMTDRALRLTLKLLRADRGNAEACRVRGVAFLLDGDFGAAQELLRAALRLDPDDAKAARTLRAAKKLRAAAEAAAQKLSRRSFGAALEDLSRALAALGEVGGGGEPPAHAALTAELHADAATALRRSGRLEEALERSQRATGARADSKKAWVSRANVLHDMGRHMQCASEMLRLLDTWAARDVQVQHCYDRAVFEGRKAKRPDYYELLGVGKVASEMEIKKAYKVAARKHHPDRHSSAPEAERRRHAEIFKQVGEGLEVLCDAFKKQLYDEGHDLEAINEKVAAAAQHAARGHPHHHHHHHGHY